MLRSLFFLFAGFLCWHVFMAEPLWAGRHIGIARGNAASRSGEFPAPDDENNKTDTQLREAINGLSKLVAIEFQAGRLRSKFPDRDQAQGAIMAFSRLGGSTSGQSAGGNSWQSSVRGDRINILIGQGSTYPMPKGDRTIGDYLRVAERRTPFRQMYFETSNQAVQLVLIDPERQRVIRLKQHDDGKILLQAIWHDRCEVFQAASFADLWYEQSELLSNQVLPHVQEMGLGIPTVSLKAKLQELVLRELRHDSAKQASFLEEFKELQADDFEARAAATRRLEEQFATWTTAIARGMRDSTLSVETRARLKKVFEAQASSDDRAGADLLARKNILDDGRFLAATLAETADSADRLLLISRLKQISGNDLGEATESWTEWAKSLPAAYVPQDYAEFQPRKSLGTTSPYFQARKDISRLLRLTSIDGQLALDRAAWKAEFGGRTVQELAEEVRAKYDSSKLPADWLDLGGGFAIETTDYPQLYFADITTQISKTSPYAHYNRAMTRYGAADQRTWNRAFDVQIASGELEMHPQNGNPAADSKVEAKYLKLNLRDASASGVLLQFQELTNRDFYLSFLDQSAELILVLSQKHGGSAQIMCVQGNVAKSVSAANVDELFREHRPEIEESVLPVLRHAGIELSPVLGGPLNIQAVETTK